MRSLPMMWLHYGDADHRPMHTESFTGTLSSLKRKAAEARADKWPLRIVLASTGETMTAAAAVRKFSARRR